MVVLFVVASGMVIYSLSGIRSGRGGRIFTPEPPETSQQPVPTVVAATCTDSDGNGAESGIYTKGTVTAINSNDEKTVSTDECAAEDSRYLIEWICSESPLGSKNFGAGRQVVKCANGCKSGACVK